MKPDLSIFMAAIEAWIELLRFDATVALFGYERIHRQLKAGLLGTCGPRALVEPVAQPVNQALTWATAFYFRPVRCLQRSVAAVRMLRRQGAPAHLVIGCRTTPFTGHAWVEIQGRVVNDEAAYQKALLVLERV